MSERLSSIVVAHDRGRVIGINGNMPWQGKLPSDMKRFVDLTKGHTVVMGRKTFESIGQPLSQRRNIILSSRADLSVEGCEVVHSLDQAFAMVEAEDEIFVIGGSQVYRAAMPVVNKLYVTEICANFEGDRYFPLVKPSEWQEVRRDFCSADEYNHYDFMFVEYERI